MLSTLTKTRLQNLMNDLNRVVQTADRIMANEKDKSYVEFAERVASQVEELEMELGMMMQSDSE